MVINQYYSVPRTACIFLRLQLVLSNCLHSGVQLVRVAVRLGNLIDLSFLFEPDCNQISFNQIFLIQIYSWNLHRRNKIDKNKSNFNQKV